MTAAQELNDIAWQLEVFRADVGRYPTQSEGLAALAKRPAKLPDWSGPYRFRHVPLDPWGHPFIYLIPGKHNSTTYDLFSRGRDELPGTADDVINWDVK